MEEKKNQSRVWELYGLRKLWETLLGIWYTRNGHHTALPPPPLTVPGHSDLILLLNLKNPLQTPFCQMDPLQGM